MGTYQSMFVEVPIEDKNCNYYWNTNTNKIQTNPAFQINKIQTENLTTREIADSFDKEYKTNEK
jgi:hypothetical protein